MEYDDDDDDFDIQQLENDRIMNTELGRDLNDAAVAYFNAQW
jgi:hypothetical protein